MKHATTRSDPIPWFDTNAESVLVCRDLAYRTWRNKKTDLNWKHFTKLRNRAVLLVRKAHQLFSKNLLYHRLDGEFLFKNMGKLDMTRSPIVDTSNIEFSSVFLINSFRNHKISRCH